MASRLETSVLDSIMVLLVRAVPITPACYLHIGHLAPLTIASVTVATAANVAPLVAAGSFGYRDPMPPKLNLEEMQKYLPHMLPRSQLTPAAGSCPAVAGQPTAKPIKMIFYKRKLLTVCPEWNDN